MARLGFIGLGNMGGPMAANLVKAGHTVVGYDLVEAHMSDAAKNGVTLAASSQDAASNVDAVITMLPGGAPVLLVYGEIIASAKPGTLFIDCSTIDVASSRRAHKLAKEAGMVSLDAPVSGGVGGAIAGTLTFMCGGERAAFEGASPYLDLMGGKSVHCGDDGAGQAAKICNNMILGISMIGVSEAFNLADKLGLDRQSLFDVSSSASGQCWSLTTYCPVPGPVPTSPANNDYKPGFSAALMHKDLKLAQEAAIQSGANTPLGAEAAQLYALYCAQGGGETDFSAIVKFLEGKT